MNATKPKKSTSKTIKKKPTRTARSNMVQYGLHIGKMIKEHIDNSPGMSQTEFSRRADLSKTALVERFKNPWYGTIYDVLEACIICHHDFLSPLIHVLKDNHIRAVGLGPVTELEELKKVKASLDSKIALLEKDNNVLHEYIEKLKQDAKRN